MGCLCEFKILSIFYHSQCNGCMQNPVTLTSNIIVPCCTINSLWPSDAISRHISGSTLAQEMTPDGSMLLPEPMLRHPQWGPLAFSWRQLHNKANLRDLITATSLVIFLKLDLNHPFFSPCDLEIWWMTQKTIGHLFYATLSFLHHFIAIGEYKLELHSGNPKSGSTSTLFWAVWPWNLMDDLQK